MIYNSNSGVAGASSFPATFSNSLTKANAMVNNTLQSIQPTLNTPVLNSFYAPTPSNVYIRNRSLQYNANPIGKTVNAASDILGSLFPPDYKGPEGGITALGDELYNNSANIMAQFNPVIGGIMKGAGAIHDTVSYLLPNTTTDKMTKVDAILDSKFVPILGRINGVLGQKSDEYISDKSIYENIGASYGGEVKKDNAASDVSNKKYGLISGSARRKANEQIAAAYNSQNLLSEINDNNTTRLKVSEMMSAINGNLRRFKLQGGYMLDAVTVGKRGFKLDRVQKIIADANAPVIQSPYELFIDSLPKPLLDTSNYRMKEYWKYHGKPSSFMLGILKGMFIFNLDDNSWHAYSVAENPATGELEFMKSKNHPSYKEEINWYNSDEASEFRSNWDLDETQEYSKYIKKSKPSSPSFIEIEISKIQEFKEGGELNVIPDGALHAHKNNMEVNNITSKGIPVISEEDGGQIRQHAEIEREEIIFRLEVTKKLEELFAEYLKEDTSKARKDELAIEAGKLLTDEIINNTQDNTNKIL